MELNERWTGLTQHRQDMTSAHEVWGIWDKQELYVFTEPLGAMGSV